MAQIMAHAAGETLDLHRRWPVAYPPDHFRRLVRAQSESLTHPEGAAPQGRWPPLLDPNRSPVYRIWVSVACEEVVTQKDARVIDHPHFEPGRYTAIAWCGLNDRWLGRPFLGHPIRGGELDRAPGPRPPGSLQTAPELSMKLVIQCR